MRRKLSRLGTSLMSLLCMCFLVLAINVFAADETHTTDCTRFIQAYKYDDAISYINDGKEDTYPTKEGWLFAGWYTDETCENEYWGQEKPGEDVYALFLPSHVLSVKAQVSANLLNDGTSDDASASIRLVTSIDTLLYKEAGFEISYTNGETTKNVTKSSNMVYERLHAVKVGTDSVGSAIYEENGKEYTPQDAFCNLSTYFKACTVKNVPAAGYITQFTVKPFWYTVDGSKVYGETATKSISEYFAMEDVYVSTTGADTLKNGTEENPFATLEYALGMVVDGGTIHIVDSYTATDAFVWEEHGKSVTISGGTIDFTALQVVVSEEEPKVNASMLHISDDVKFEGTILKFTPDAHVFAQGHRVEVTENVSFTTPITICGGSYLKDITSNTNLILKAGEYNTIYGGGFGGDVTGNTNITLSGTVNEDADYKEHIFYVADGARRLFGGGYGGVVNGDTNIDVQTATVEFNYIFGGGHYSAVKGDSHINYAGSAMSIYGGGYSKGLTGDAYITMTNGWVHQIFGGCHGSSTDGNTNIDVQGGTVERRVYGGCYNEPKNGTWTSYCVNGYATVKVSKEAKIEFGYLKGDNSLVSFSRRNVVSEAEKGVFLFTDYENNDYVNKIGRDYSAQVAGVIEQTYNYLVKAEANGTVSADGNYLIIKPNEGLAAKVIIDENVVHYTENETAYKLPVLDSSTEKKEILIEFDVPDTSIDTTKHEAKIGASYYETLEEAVNAAEVLSTKNKNVVVTLLDNVEVESTMSIDKNANVTVESDEGNQYTINRAIALISEDGEMFNVSEGNTLTVKNVVLDGRTALEVGSENADQSATLIYNEGTTNVDNVTAQYSTGAAIQTKGSDAVLSLDTVTVTNPGGSGLTLSSGTVHATDVTVENTTDVAIGVGADATFYMNNVTLSNIGSGTGHHGICNYGGTICTADEAEQALTVQNVQGHAIANLDNGTVLINGVKIEDVKGQDREAIYSNGGIIVVANATIKNMVHDGIRLLAGTTTVVDTVIENVARSGITATDSTNGTSEVIAKNVTVRVSDDAAEGTKSSQYGIYCVRGTVYADNIRIENTSDHAVLNNDGQIQNADFATQAVTVVGAAKNGIASISTGITTLTGVTIQDVVGKGISSADTSAVYVENVTVDNAADAIYMNHEETTGEFTVKHATITGVTRGIAIAKGKVIAEDVTVEKSAVTGAKTHTYGVFVSSANSTAELKDVTVEDATTAGVGTTGGTVTANNVTVTGGAAGVETKAGTMQKATDATTGITVNGTSYGIKNMSGTTTLKNVVINNTTVAGVYIEAGTLNTENVTVNGGPVGIETKAGTVTGVSVENITQAGIKKESGTSTVKNVTITNEKKSEIFGIKMTDGTLFLDTIHVTGGNKGIHITGGTLGTADTSIKDVTITGTNHHAVHIENATVYADDLEISNVQENTRKGIVVQGGTAVVKNSTISNINNSAVYIAKSSAAAANVTLEGVNITQCGAYGIQMDSANDITTTLNAVTIDQAASGITFKGGTLTVDDLAITGTAKCMDVNGAATITGKVSFIPTSYTEGAVVVAKGTSGTADQVAIVSGLVEIAPDVNGGVWFANSEGKLTKAVAVIDDAYYTDFASALTAAENMDEVTITLADNVSLSEAIVVNNNLTIKSTKAITIQWETDTTSDMIKVSSEKEFKILGEEDKKITVERTQTSTSSSHVIYNSGITELSHVIIKGGRIGVQSAGTNIIINNTTIQDTGNKGLTIADGNATINNSTIKNTPDNGIFLYKDGKGSGIKNVELNNVIVNDVTGSGIHGINIAEGNVTVKNELRIERVSGYGIAVTGGTLTTDPATNGTIEVKAATRCGIYASVAINVAVTSISDCEQQIGAKNAIITINGVSKLAPSTNTYYSLSDFTSN